MDDIVFQRKQKDSVDGRIAEQDHESIRESQSNWFLTDGDVDDFIYYFEADRS